MDIDTIITLGVNIALSGLTAFAVASFRIGQYTNKVDNLETTVGRDDHAGLRRTVNDHSVKISACETMLDQRGPLGKRKSPLSLTDRGSRFLVESGGRKFVDDNYQELLRAVDAMNPKTSYDVQEDANMVIAGLKDDERLNPMKEYLFREGMTLEDLFFVMGIHLRDKILAEKGLNAEDIDHQEGAAKA